MAEQGRNGDRNRGGEDYHFGHSEQFRSLYDYDPLTCLLPKLAIAEGNIYALSRLISGSSFTVHSHAN